MHLIAAQLRAGANGMDDDGTGLCAARLSPRGVGPAPETLHRPWPL